MTRETEKISEAWDGLAGLWRNFKYQRVSGLIEFDGGSGRFSRAGRFLFLNGWKSLERGIIKDVSEGVSQSLG